MKQFKRHIEKKVYSFFAEQFFIQASRIFKHHPRSNPAAHGVEVIKNICYIAPVLSSFCEDYLPEPAPNRFSLDLADPLCFLERESNLDRKFPPVFVFAGDKDPIKEDTLRLHRSLEKHGLPCKMKLYPGSGHAFHAFLSFDTNAKQCWQDQFRFLEGYLD